MNKKKLLLAILLTIFIAGICINGVSASKTIKMKGYKVKLSNKEIKDLKTHKYWYLLKSTHKKLKDVTYYTDVKLVEVEGPPEGYNSWNYKGVKYIDGVQYYKYTKKKKLIKKGTVKIGIEKNKGKYTAELINDYPMNGDAGYRVISKKKIKI